MMVCVLLFYLYSVKFSTREQSILPEAFNDFSLSMWLQDTLSSLYIHVLSINNNMQSHLMLYNPNNDTVSKKQPKFHSIKFMLAFRLIHIHSFSYNK